MTERDKKLVREFGPVTFKRMSRILDDLGYLPSDAYSVMTDEEWCACGEAMIKFQNELSKVRQLVFDRMEEVGVEPKR